MVKKSPRETGSVNWVNAAYCPPGIPSWFCCEIIQTIMSCGNLLTFTEFFLPITLELIYYCDSGLALYGAITNAWHTASVRHASDFCKGHFPLHLNVQALQILSPQTELWMSDHPRWSVYGHERGNGAKLDIIGTDEQTNTLWINKVERRVRIKSRFSCVHTISPSVH